MKTTLQKASKVPIDSGNKPRGRVVTEKTMNTNSIWP